MTLACANRHTKKIRNPREQKPTENHLRKAKAKDFGSETPQARRLQFQPDHEEKKDNTEFGDVPDLIHIGEHRKPIRPNRGPGGEVSQYRTKAETFEQRNGKHRCAQLQGDTDQKRIGSGGGIGQNSVLIAMGAVSVPAIARQVGMPWDLVFCLNAQCSKCDFMHYAATRRARVGGV